MRPRIWAVALGVLTTLALCLLIAAQAPLVRLAITNGVNYLFPPLLALAVFTLCLTMAAQAILLAVQQTQPRTSQLDAARLYRID